MSQKTDKPGIEWKRFGTTRDGQPVAQIVLSPGNGSSASLLTYGATLSSLVVPDKQGNFGDIVLGFDALDPYETQSPYFGAVIGRVGNRIAKGRFALDAGDYALVINNGENHLHGGFKGYDKRVWHAETAMLGGSPAVRFTIRDVDGSEGYPGNVDVTVVYSFGLDGVLRLQYFARTDAPTPINLTNHTYWNLLDAGKSPIYDHVVQAEADTYIPVDESLIPTGHVKSIEGTWIDFRSPKPLGRDLRQEGGYDHCLVLRNQDGSLAKAIDVTEPMTGRHMEVWTTEPGCQLYSGNFLDGTVTGKGGAVYGQHHAFCLETQHYPDSPNQPEFPSTILWPGSTYRQITDYRFDL
jgi:aldose 1-epimerase